MKRTGEEKKQVVDAVAHSVAKAGMTVREALRYHKVSSASYYTWKNELKATSTPASTKRKNKELDESIESKVVTMKQEHPYYGLSKICMQLKRFNGIQTTTSQVSAILKKHDLQGTEPKKPWKEKGKRRFERVDTLELLQMDIMYYTLRKGVRFYLISVLDDHSRFICSHRVCTAQKAENVIDTFTDAVERHGKPQQVLTDRGGQFHSWNGISQFRKTLSKLGVEHIVANAQSPQTIGKIESWHRNIQRELLRQKEFHSVEDARDAIAKYVEYYNHERVHMGINYVTPADRFYGVEKPIQAEMANSQSKQSDLYLAARIDGQPIRVEQDGPDTLVVKLAGKSIKSVTLDEVKTLLL